MRYIAHTMGTPGRTVYESIDAFRAMGFDGMELVCRAGTDFDCGIDDARAVRMADYAAYNALPIVALTPYAWDINSADPAARSAAIGELQRAIHLADLMRVRFVRAYGGRLPDRDPEASFGRAVEALAALAPKAAARRVTILVENHPGSLTRTGVATRRLVDAVGHAHVRCLYDPANVLHDTDEPWETTLAVQTGCIAYVHAKDYDWADGKRRARIVGEGIVPWAAILDRLVGSGFAGCIAFEYEKQWYPDQLPEAETGMAASLRFVRETVALCTPARCGFQPRCRRGRSTQPVSRHGDNL